MAKDSTKLAPGSDRRPARQARRLFLAALPAVLAANYSLGVWNEAAALVVLTYMYNDLRGGDDHFLLRNFIIAAAFACYNEGSLRVASGPLGVTLTIQGWQWVALVSAVIFTTMHVQDMKDVAGDTARGRRTAPIVLGDGPARWTIAVAVAVWAFVCPTFWGLPIHHYIAPVGLGGLIVARLLLMRSQKADRTTWQIWTGWTACLYFLPSLKDHQLLSATWKIFGNGPSPALDAN